tara:strand:- start:55 stop:903 length:849 start_codon:yes stop_codon:yes gene_type:complete
VGIFLKIVFQLAFGKTTFKATIKGITSEQLMTKIRTVIVTHDEPLFLRGALEGIFDNCSELEILCIFKGPAPQMIQGKTIFKRGKTVLKKFGFLAFTFYSYKLIQRKILLLSATKPNYAACKVEHIKSINSDQSIALINSFKPDLILSLLAGEIFKKDVIDIAPMGILNVHTGQLPKYKGLMPTFWALKNREPVIGISTFIVNDEIDGGKVIGYFEIETLNNSHFEIMKIVYRNLWASINIAIKNINKKEELIFPKFLPDQYFSAPSRNDVKEFIARGGKLF